MSLTYYDDATTTEVTGIDIKPKIEGLDPWQTPIDALLNQLPGDDVDGPYFQWEGAAEQIVYVTLGAAMDSSQVSVTVVSTVGLVVDDILEEYGTTNGEQIRVTEINTATTFTCVRNINNVGGEAHDNGDKLYVVGKAVAEGGSPNKYTFTPNEYYNYISIIACEINRTLVDEHTKFRTDRQAYHDREVMLAYKKAWERVFLYGDRYKDATNHFWYTGGLKFWTDYAESNKIDANMSHVHSSTLAALTLALWNAYLIDVFTYGDSNKKLIVAGSVFIQKIIDLYEGKVEINYTDQLGFDMPVIHTIHGQVGFIEDPCMKGTYNEPRYWGFSIDPKYLRARTLIPHTKRDINYGSALQSGYQIYQHKGLEVSNPFTLVQYNISAAS